MEGNKRDIKDPVWLQMQLRHPILNKVGLASPGALR